MDNPVFIREIDSKPFQHVCRLDLSNFDFATRELLKLQILAQFREWCRPVLPFAWWAIPSSGLDLYVDRRIYNHLQFANRYGKRSVNVKGES